MRGTANLKALVGSEYGSEPLFADNGFANNDYLPRGGFGGNRASSSHLLENRRARIPLAIVFPRIYYDYTAKSRAKRLLPYHYQFRATLGRAAPLRFFAAATPGL